MSGKTKRAGKLNVTRIVVFLVSIGVLVVCWRLGLKWVAGGVILTLLLYLLVLPKLMVARAGKFNRKALALLTSGKHPEVIKLARRDILLQLFGPRGAIEAKVGLAYAADEQFGRAIPLFERAIPAMGKNEGLPLRIGLAKSLFVTGDFSRAKKEGMLVLTSGTRLPELLAVVARSRVGLGQIDDETRELLDEAERLSPNEDVALMLELTRVEIAVKTGRRPEELKDSLDSSTRFLRAWISLVRGLLREKRGDEKASIKSYTKAIKIDSTSFCAAEARKCLERLNSGETKIDVNNTEMDSAVRRKKRRKR